MSDDHKQTARGIIERMKTIRPTCDKCQRLAYGFADEYFKLASYIIEGKNIGPIAPRKEVNYVMESFGFEESVERPGYVKRCAECAGKLTFPWAAQLDIDRVAHMLEHDPRCENAFPLAILEETLRAATGGFKYL